MCHDTERRSGKEGFFGGARVDEFPDDQALVVCVNRLCMNACVHRAWWLQSLESLHASCFMCFSVKRDFQQEGHIDVNRFT